MRNIVKLTLTLQTENPFPSDKKTNKQKKNSKCKMKCCCGSQFQTSSRKKKIAPSKNRGLRIRQVLAGWPMIGCYPEYLVGGQPGWLCGNHGNKETLEVTDEMSTAAQAPWTNNKTLQSSELTETRLRLLVSPGTTGVSDSARNSCCDMTHVKPSGEQPSCHRRVAFDCCAIII